MADNKYFKKKGSKVEIEEVHTSSGLEFNINFNGGTDYYTVAKCWDYLLAEKIRDAVSDYMQEVLAEYETQVQDDIGSRWWQLVLRGFAQHRKQD